MNKIQSPENADTSGGRTAVVLLDLDRSKQSSIGTVLSCEPYFSSLATWKKILRSLLWSGASWNHFIAENVFASDRLRCHDMHVLHKG
jgi:hypothetical protein